MKGKRILKALKIFVIVLVAATAFSFIVMSLWNWLMPAIFGLHAISFWQALGILVLSKVLFNGFRGGRGCGRHWRGRMAERWEHMTPEERQKFQEGIRGGCGSVERSSPVPQP